MKKQKENSVENITWTEMRKQSVQAKEVNWPKKVTCNMLEAEEGDYQNRRHFKQILFEHLPLKVNLNFLKIPLTA